MQPELLAEGRVRDNVNRPTGWKPNPQALASVSKRRTFVGHELLGKHVDSDTWLTPRYILSQLGTFDLDPCAAKENPVWVCDKYYTKYDDGLRSDWFGRVFMNPPFSNTRDWLIKHSQYAKGISLVAASVESRVWRDCVWRKARAILLLHGRTRFCNPDGSATVGRPLRSIALIGWADADAQILATSTLAGVLLTHWSHR